MTWSSTEINQSSERFDAVVGDMAHLASWRRRIAMRPAGLLSFCHKSSQSGTTTHFVCSAPARTSCQHRRMDEVVGLRQQKKQRTREQIGAVAVDLVDELGMAAARVEDICERAEIGRSTFFRYFDSKESAFVAGVQHGRREAILSALAARPGDETAFSAARAAFIDVIGRGNEVRDSLVLEYRIRTESPLVYARSVAHRQSMDLPIAALLEPRLRAPDAALQARLLARLAITVAHLASDQWITDGAKGSPRRYIAKAFDAAVHMMRGEC